MFGVRVLVIYLLVLKDICTGQVKIECGYKVNGITIGKLSYILQQCPQTREGALNVHLVPHSHMDAGWVKTFDEYYYGTKTTVSTANVQLIYHSVLSELLHDKKRKFTFSETAYFWRWWKEQRPTTRTTFRAMIQEGRIEFAGGGWVENDEATTDYLQIIDQFTWGLRKINDTLGPCGKPKAAWQIDTYGHSREQVSLLAQMGYDGLFLGRVDHKERESMIDEDRMEFMWRGSDVLGKMSDIMTHSLFNLYNTPEGFCFDFLCSDEPIVDDPDSKVYNADKRVNDFMIQIEKQAKYYDHDNILVTMGGDFTYQSAANWFINIDKLINHVNTHSANMSDINIFYSTPSCYLKAIYLYGRRDKAVYTEKADHLPYGSDVVTYWTGYYTSRPSLKYLIRKAHIFLQVVKQLTVLAKLGDSYELHLLRHAVSLVLHHDAITGTSQQHVTNDFIRILSEAIETCSKKVSSLLSFLTPTWGGSRRSKNNQQFIICHQLNMSQCRFSETQEPLLLLIYNPLSIKTNYYVRLPAIGVHYSIRDYNDEEVDYQLIPLPAAIINLPGRSSTAIQELCFEADNIAPLGFTTYYISSVRDHVGQGEYHKKTSPGNTEAEPEIIPFISNEYLKVTVDKTTGLLQSISHVDGVQINMSQNFFYYGQTQQQLQSGAYSFRPEKQRPMPISEKVFYNTVRGSLIKEIRQRFTDWITQIIRLYRGEEYVELEWIIGPVPIGTDLGKEIVSIFSTNITNNGEFFTDSNGRQMMRRTCWNETATQQQKRSIASCYYPVTSRICIHSSNSSLEMCILTDRTQGGTSYNDGEIELMVHRRLLTDDGFGLEEALNEEAFGVGLVVKGKHRIMFGNYRQYMDDLTFSERLSFTQRKWQYEPWLFLTSAEKMNRRKWQSVRNKRFSALKVHGLPRHIHILTLEPWKAGTALLRLENTLESPFREHNDYKSDNLDNPEDYTAKLAQTSVDLKKIFLRMKIKAIRETTLAANQWLDDARQMDWSTRYVYSGADDGFLPEDIDEGLDKPSKIEEQDSGHYSDEEQAMRHQNKIDRQKFQALKRPRSRSGQITDHHRYFNRRKRSTNFTEYGSNIATNDTFTTDFKLNNVTTIKQVDKIVVESTTSWHMLTKNNNREKESHIIKMTQKSPRLSFLNRIKTYNISRTWTSDTSSEADFANNMKRKSYRKRNRVKSRRESKEIESTTDDVDDGITKSIYDMYYRQQKLHERRRLSINSEKENISTQKRSRRYNSNDDNDALVGRTTKRNHLLRSRRVPYYMRRRRVATSMTPRKEKTKATTVHPDRFKESREYDEDHEADEYNEEEMYTRAESNRRKRTLPKDDDASDVVEESEYVVTLRPTQIRTFVIWFGNTQKKSTPG